jgi:ATP-dependent Lon protease
LREKISEQVSSELVKEQKEYVLRRQLNEIQKELGEDESTKDTIKTLRDRIDKISLPDQVFTEVQKQLGKLSRLSEIAPEYHMIYSYLEFILDLPWAAETKDNLDLNIAQRILDEDHFDLKDVKQRILEHLAVRKLNPQAKAPILCFLGPPGVGKTSLGQSIARALGRKFEHMSLGGVHDESELRGHRRTYIGAMPGRIMQAISRAGVRNPLLMLDEVDKIGRDFRGDPAGALIEILDPSQNFEFHDNYLDMPFDLSQVFFVTTANTTQSIAQPLLDRMEILRLPGYSSYEKYEIAKRYLIPRQIEQCGIPAGQVHLQDNALREIIEGYTQEAGVRELERVISRVMRRVALDVAKGNSHRATITKEKLEKFVGRPRPYLEQIRKVWSPGVATGLAWTEAGGNLIFIESRLFSASKPRLRITGHIGKVMRESAQTALSFVWSMEDWTPNEADAGIHIHIPAGAIPKDGPSAGLAITSALTSLYSGFPVRQDTAMTGEITLAGLVLPVGGIKEKILAAHRAKIKRVILPKQNEADLNDVPQEVKDEIDFIPVDNIHDALAEAIPDLVRRQTVAV